MSSKRRLRPYDLEVARNASRVANREREAVPDCWFCDQPKGKTREHIFPRWLTGEMGERETDVTPTRLELVTGKTASTTKRPLAGLVARGICATCNNGWMSQLEEQVRPHLMDKPRPSPMSEDAAYVLARWFAKTAAVLNVSQNWRMIIRKEDRHALATGIPSNVLVALSRIQRPDGKRIDWQQSSPMMVRTPKGMPRDYVIDLAERTLVSNIQVGDLGGTAIFAARPLTTRAIAELLDALVIWPPPQERPNWRDLPIVETVRVVMPILEIPPNPFLR